MDGSARDTQDLTCNISADDSAGQHCVLCPRVCRVELAGLPLGVVRAMNGISARARVDRKDRVSPYQHALPRNLQRATGHMYLWTLSATHCSHAQLQMHAVSHPNYGFHELHPYAKPIRDDAPLQRRTLLHYSLDLQHLAGRPQVSHQHEDEIYYL